MGPFENELEHNEMGKNKQENVLLSSSGCLVG